MMDRWASSSAARANADEGKRFVPRRRMMEVRARMVKRKMAVRQNRSSGLRCLVARKMTRMVVATKNTMKGIIVGVEGAVVEGSGVLVGTDGFFFVIRIV